VNFLLTRHKGESKKFGFLLAEYEFSHKKEGLFSILVQDETEFNRSDQFVSFIDGYLRNFDISPSFIQEQQESCISHILQQWPVEQNITGSFSIAIIERNSWDITICNDVIGPYPIYFLVTEDNFYISNSIIWMGAVSGNEVDEVGVVQRALGPELSNLGSRTIIKNCKRLLPGAWIKFRHTGEIVERKYDNTLFNNPISRGEGKNFHQEYWALFKKDIRYCLSSSSKANLALSGGIDSRIVLGGLPKEKEITCHTYGSNNFYETRVARNLARIKKSNFHNYFRPNLHFPVYEMAKDYTRKTEALYLGSWLEILEAQNVGQREPFLLGDLTESLQGRNIKRYSSKKVRRMNFFKTTILKKDFTFETADKTNFRLWKEKVKQDYQTKFRKEKLEKFGFRISADLLWKEVLVDLNELFDRIENHHIPFQELYDELFSWYTHARMPMGKQILIVNEKFLGYCPAMSLQVIRLTSRILPNCRLNSRFIKFLFRNIDDLKKLGKVPTSQIPLLPLNSHDILRFPMWAFRSKFDYLLTKRRLKSKHQGKKNRLFESFDWAYIYQNPKMEDNVKSYFENDFIGENYTSKMIKHAIQRKELNEWPFANLEILSAAGLNIELQIINKLISAR
jgi:hypothetical protein